MTWSDMIGREFGHYRITEELGRGGSARVFKARDTRAETDVAIKIIPNDAENRTLFVQRFQREIDVVRKLNHPNIVAVYDAGKTEDLVYLVMQCVEGGTLRDRVAESRLEVPLAASYAVQMARALHHAHRQGIVHRDVKPSNMLLDARDPTHVLLADFGIAKIQGMRGITKSGTTLGTPEYMSPEQAQGHECDPRSDIYALGCVVYELLTGQPPFKAPLPVAVLYRHVYERPTYIRSYNSAVPKALCRVVEVALEKEPDLRYPTAEHFARALAPFVQPGYHGTQGESPEDVTLPPISALQTLPPALAGTAAPISGSPSPGSPTPLHLGTTPSPRDTSPGSGPLGPWRPTLEDLGDDALEHAETVPRIPSFSGPASAATSGPLADLTDAGALEALVDRDTLGAAVQVGQGAQTNGATSGPSRARTRTDPLTGLNLPRRAPGTTSSSLSRYTGAPLLQGEVLDPAIVIAAEEAKRWPEAPSAGSDDPGQVPPRRHRTRTLLLVVAMLAVVVAGWLGLSASGVVALPAIPVLGAQAATPSPTHVPTATATATEPATATPQDATPTVFPQAVADRQAAASFSAVTLGTTPDKTCAQANDTPSFTSGTPIYINLCTSSSVASSSVSISIRQAGSVCTLPVTATNSYNCHANYTLAPGHYDMLVTMRINGTTGTARDLHFTVVTP